MQSKVCTSVCDEAWLTRFIGHKYLYERGVLHRDISPGNILIKWRPGCDVDQPSTSGCLIDLDHAKKGKPFSGLVTARPADKDDVDFALLWCSMKGVEPDVAHQALTFFPAIYAIVYLDAALANALRFRPLNGQLCTRHHLGWKEVRLHRSSFLFADYPD